MTHLNLTCQSDLAFLLHSATSPYKKESTREVPEAQNSEILAAHKIPLAFIIHQITVRFPNSFSGSISLLSTLNMKEYFPWSQYPLP